jgi:hypothetical protein
MFYLKVGHSFETVGLVLVLLNLRDDLSHLPPLAVVKQWYSTCFLFVADNQDK